MWRKYRTKDCIGLSSMFLGQPHLSLRCGRTAHEQGRELGMREENTEREWKRGYVGGTILPLLSRHRNNSKQMHEILSSRKRSVVDQERARESETDILQRSYASWIYICICMCARAQHQEEPVPVYESRPIQKHAKWKDI